MLKFIDEKDFLLVDTFKENEDGSVSWVWDEGEGLPTHSGVIRQGFTRTDDEGNEIDVWQALQDSGVSIQAHPVDNVREQARQQIDQQRDALISGGVEFEGNTFQTSANSIMDLMGAVISGIDTTWLTVNNAEVAMTAAKLQQLGQVVAQHKESIVFKARAHKNAINAMTTRAEINSYMQSISWG